MGPYKQKIYNNTTPASAVTQNLSKDIFSVHVPIQTGVTFIGFLVSSQRLHSFRFLSQ